MNLKERLKSILEKEELENLISGFEIIGDVAIIQVPEILESKKFLIAEAVKEQNKNIRTVIRKKEKVSGEFRIPKYEFLIGNDSKTIHKEFSCQYNLDITEVYFSSKLGTERMRIASQVKDGERVLVLFAGTGPYAILIAKKFKPKVVYAVEKNLKAYEYLINNIKRNKVENKVIPIREDAKNLLKYDIGKFDRIILPLPERAHKFLNIAFKMIKNKGIIHYYKFSKINEIKEVENFLNEKAKEFGKRIKILGVFKAGAFAPRVYRLCFDIEVEKFINM